jgi:hypothetical protein
MILVYNEGTLDINLDATWVDDGVVNFRRVCGSSWSLG